MTPQARAHDKPAKPAKPRKKRAAATGALPSRKKQEMQAHKFAVEAARLANDLHAQDLLVLDVRRMSDVTDYILIASGTSDRQIRALGQNIAELGQQMDLPRYGQDEDGSATWIVLDFVDVVVHLFDPMARAHYDLEMLWGDAPKLAWRRKPAAKKKPAEGE